VSRVHHISFEELAANLAERLDQVRNAHASIVVEYANGEMVMIKPYAPSHRGAGRGQRKNAGSAQSPGQTPDDENKSSMGAVYDFDPDSITPG
jgi:hypothetical protein